MNSIPQLDNINHLAFSYDGKYLFSSSDTTDKLWQQENRFKPVEEFFSERKYTQGLSCFEFSPDSRYLAIGTDNGEVIVLDLEKFEKVFEVVNDKEEQAPALSS